MTTKERLINELDSLPEDILREVLKYIRNLKKTTTQEKTPPLIKLQGRLDDVDIRKKAYE